MFNVFGNSTAHNGEGMAVLTGTILSNNILMRAFDEEIEVSPMKLQKLLYYIFKEYLRQTGKAPFSELFEVWEYGPVLPSVYSEFHSYGKNPIRKFARDSLGAVFIANEDTDDKLKAAIDYIWARFKNYSAISLSMLTHKPKSAWTFADSESRSTITLDDMLKEIQEAADIECA